MVWPGSVVKMHHILHLISLMGEGGQQHFHRASTVKITLTHTQGFLSFCGFHFYPTRSLKKRSQPKKWQRTNRLFDYQVGGISGHHYQMGMNFLFLCLGFAFCFCPCGSSILFCFSIKNCCIFQLWAFYLFLFHSPLHV